MNIGFLVSAAKQKPEKAADYRIVKTVFSR